jgi:hypothetical protein
MALLWFVHAEAMYGFPVYQLPVPAIIRKLGGKASFKFLCRLDKAPERARAHNRDHVASYDRVLLELGADEAWSVRWRSGFYEVQHSPKDLFDILGQPNVPTEGDGTEPDTDATCGLNDQQNQ